MINWGASNVQEELKARIGDRIRFVWDGDDNVWSFATESAYENCDFQVATEISSNSPVEYYIESLPLYFASNVGSNCNEGHKLFVSEEGNEYVVLYFHQF